MRNKSGGRRSCGCARFWKREIQWASPKLSIGIVALKGPGVIVDASQGDKKWTEYTRMLTTIRSFGVQASYRTTCTIPGLKPNRPAVAPSGGDGVLNATKLATFPASKKWTTA